MTDEPENLTLRMLRRIDARLDAIENRLDLIEQRQRGVEHQTTALLQGQDAMRADLARVKRRLDLSDAPAD